MPLAVAATSPLLAWRDPVYVAAGLAGVVALALMLVQPLLATGSLPGLGPVRSRLWHRVVGTLLLATVVLHVAGLWVTSPPDVIDVLLFRSPTPFSVWGALALWAVIGAGALAAIRRRIRIPPRVWRRAHLGLAALAVGGTAAHALLIQGTMGTLSKVALCALALAATAYALARHWPWRGGMGRKDRSARA